MIQMKRSPQYIQQIKGTITPMEPIQHQYIKILIQYSKIHGLASPPPRTEIISLLNPTLLLMANNCFQRHPRFPFIMDNGSKRNIVAHDLISYFHLPTIDHPTLHQLSQVQKYSPRLLVMKCCMTTFSIRICHDIVHYHVGESMKMVTLFSEIWQ